VDTTLDYGNVHLGGADFLLPTATRQRFIGRDDTESKNRYAFSCCRDFQAESKVSFGEKSAPFRHGQTARDAAAAMAHRAESRDPARNRCRYRPRRRG
jgi:hypothetical protein